MNKRIFTGNYEECKAGNLISISGDKGKSAGFNGKVISEFAPKRKFWDKWRDNIGKIPELENTKYYIEEYYKQVLSKIKIQELLKDEKIQFYYAMKKDNNFVIDMY